MVESIAVIFCDHCQKDPGPKSKGSTLWKGFLDGDTKQHVCWSCQPIHYQKKFQLPGLANIYSELPVSIIKVDLEKPKRSAKQLALNLSPNLSEQR